MSLKDVPVRARLWAPDRSLPRFFGRLLLFLSDSTLRLLPSTFGRWKRAEVSLKRAVLHPRATKMYESVAQACRAAPSGDEDVRKCCPREPCCTLGRRRCTKVWPKGAVLHPRATIKYESVAQGSRAALSGDEDVRKCCPREPCCTLGQREGAEESPDCAARHLRVRDSQASSFPESSAPSPAPVVGRGQGAGRMVVRPLYPAYSFDIWKFLLFLS